MMTTPPTAPGRPEAENSQRNPQASPDGSTPGASTKSKDTPLWKVLLPIGAIIVLVVTGMLLIRSGTEQTAPSSPSRMDGNPTAANESFEFRVGATVPDFTLKKYGAGEVKASELSSKVKLVNFWASWCEACMVEMPSIVKLYHQYKDRGFDVVAVNLDDNPEEVLPRTLKRFKMDFSIYFDPESRLAEMFDVHAIPVSVVLDKNLKILMIENGERDWNSEEIRSQLEKWLSG